MISYLIIQQDHLYKKFIISYKEKTLKCTMKKSKRL